MHPSRPLLLCAFLVAPAGASATMIGNPVSHPDAGRFALGIAGDTSATIMKAQECDGDACQAVWRPTQVGGRAELVLFRGVGLQGGGSYLYETIEEADYEGRGSSVWGGLEAAFPVGTQLWLAAVGQFQFTFSDDATANTDEQTRATRLRLAALLAWAPDDHGASVYGGFSFHPLYSQTTQLDRYQLEIDLRPLQPPGAVLGLEVRSQQVGLPWSDGDGRMLMGIEIAVESGLGGGLWLGAAF